MRNRKWRSGVHGYIVVRAIAVLMTLATSGTFPEVAHATDQLENKQIVQRAFAAWARGTGSPYDLLADDVNWTITGNSLASKSYSSKAAFIGEVIRPFNARMSVGLRPAIRNIYSEGDTVIVFFDASGTAKDGKPYANTYAWFLDLNEGKIVRASAFFDSIAFNDLWTRLPVEVVQ